MYEYITGYIDRCTPTEVVVDNAGFGYLVRISLNTYTKINELSEVKLFLHYVVREDAQLFYGFFEEGERQLFRLLLSVNGVGANTAQTMLSSLSVDEIRHAILTSDVGILQGVKGIGAKSAQRIIVDLKDKVGKTAEDDFKLLIQQENQVFVESEAALLNLGFNKKQIDKALGKLTKEMPDATVEELIKSVLKII